MKYHLTLICILCSLIASAQTSKDNTIIISPLSDYSTAWNNPIYTKCNTAANAAYMSKTEKDVIYILNIVRSYPVQFANNVLRNYPEKSSMPWISNTTYYQSLMDTLLKLTPINLLLPDKACYVSAECHASNAGRTGFVGHERQTNECKKKLNYNAECCDYGSRSALDIVLSLLIDENVPSLGHRWACLGSYKTVGVSVQPHKTYRYNSVLDFSY